MIVSDESVRAQLALLGARFGLIPVVVDGQVFAGEAVPVTLPLTPGISVLVDVDVPISRVDGRFTTIKDILGRRKMKHERDARERREKYEASRRAPIDARLRDLNDALERDWRAAERGVLRFAMPG